MSLTSPENGTEKGDLRRMHLLSNARRQSPYGRLSFGDEWEIDILAERFPEDFAQHEARLDELDAYRNKKR